MKDLISFIKEAKTSKRKSVLSQPGNCIKLDIPNTEYGDITDGIWKTLELPKAKYFVYNDYYRNSWHFASLDDMIGNMLYFEDDFEDFDPKKDIMFSDNDYKVVIADMLEKLLKFNIKEYKNFEEALAAIMKLTDNDDEERVYESGIADNLSMLVKYYFDKEECEFNDFEKVENLVMV